MKYLTESRVGYPNSLHSRTVTETIARIPLTEINQIIYIPFFLLRRLTYGQLIQLGITHLVWNKWLSIWWVNSPST